MIPDNVLNAVYDQLRPLVMELARYNAPGETVQVNFDVGSVEIKFNSNRDEDNN